MYWTQLNKKLVNQVVKWEIMQYSIKIKKWKILWKRNWEKEGRLRSSTTHLKFLNERIEIHSRGNVWRDNDREFSEIGARHEYLIEKLVSKRNETVEFER